MGTAAEVTKLLNGSETDSKCEVCLFSPRGPFIQVAEAEGRKRQKRIKASSAHTKPCHWEPLACNAFQKLGRQSQEERASQTSAHRIRVHHKDAVQGYPLDWKDCLPNSSMTDQQRESAFPGIQNYISLEKDIRQISDPGRKYEIQERPDLKEEALCSTASKDNCRSE